VFEMVNKIGEKDFEERVLKADKPVLLDFGAAYCGPCKKLAPIVATIAEELKDKLYVYEVDAGEEPKIAQQYGVMSLPTLLIFQAGNLKERIVGMTSKDKILKKLEPML
jgi:thioredoxin 1